MSRALLPVLIALMAACGEAKTSSGARTGELNGKSDASTRGGSDAAGASDESCHTDAGQRLICDPSKLAGVAWGPTITVRQGESPPPAPKGGTIVSGAYQLVSEALYGSVPANTDWPRPGDTIQRILDVDCDIANELYRAGDRNVGGAQVSSLGASNDCHRLVSRPLSVLEAGNFFNAQGQPLFPDSEGAVSYTADGQTLRLIVLFPYEGRDGILGSYTTVEDYAFVAGKGAHPAVSSTNHGETPRAAPTKRDPRCPAMPPGSGDACSPDPAPLECEYGGDRSRHCTTFAACVLDIDRGTYHFQVDAPTDCTQANLAECPKSFTAGQALEGKTLSAAPAPSDAGAYIDTWSYGVTCNYAEGVCACQAGGSCTDPIPCTWTCRDGSKVVDDATSTPCPWPRPLAGDPCEPGVQCEYGRSCGDRTSLGPSMVCQNGYWAQTDGFSRCPADIACQSPHH